MIVANTLPTQWARPEVTDDPQGTLRAETGVSALQLHAGRLGVAHYTRLIIYKDNKKKKDHVSSCLRDCCDWL